MPVAKLYAEFRVQVSAVQKIARVMPLKEGLTLYRGLGGPVCLPNAFFKADQNGCHGFVEWGFMSTTADKMVAIDYSDASRKAGGEDSSQDWTGTGRGSLPMVLVVRVSSVDRGACIRDFSQYMQEVEYLWVPGSYLQQVMSSNDLFKGIRFVRFAVKMHCHAP